MTEDMGRSLAFWVLGLTFLFLSLFVIYILIKGGER